MKKKILFVGSFLVAISAVAVHSYSEKNDFKDLMWENVEALALGEWESGGTCLSRGSVDCPIGNIKVKYIISNQ
ncbi:NVEALA domain-containing protein [Bacteroides helcogenes]|uniref:NVEALA family protein n=1 Tax=Bacteroides helcogenes (strain ATCC 35417 / DSM 20613 / JCM 6297 / CCUG 15421 / P 36-108) TaxID=693979 RepID=E6SUI6_BACT6|nr:NVEALA domain-containing protein [Bacteroides helcogenes]ADV43350.1 hypothetical protein Bache_1344 [Bacteroides helcogenes P 36-108]MDY5238118.1 NVEALA domain-containing protein [Bacteroides helcogenes]